MGVLIATIFVALCVIGPLYLENEKANTPGSHGSKVEAFASNTSDRKYHCLRSEPFYSRLT
jgi:hypothetical protein